MTKYKNYLAASALLCSAIAGMAFAQPTFAATTVNKLMAKTGFDDENLFECVISAYESANSTTKEAILAALGENDPLPADKLANIASLTCTPATKVSSAKGIGTLTGLKTLNLLGNSLTSIDLSKNTALTALNLNNNNLTSVDLSKNTALSELHVSGNNIKKLDLSKVTGLTILDANDTDVTFAARAKKTENGYTFALPTINVATGTAWVPKESSKYTFTSGVITVPKREDLADGFVLQGGTKSITVSANPTQVSYTVASEGEGSPIVDGSDVLYVGEKWDSDTYLKAIETELKIEGIKNKGVKAFGNGSTTANTSADASSESTATHVFGTVPETLFTLDLVYDLDIPVPEAGTPDTGFFTNDEQGNKAMVSVVMVAAALVVMAGLVSYSTKRQKAKSRFYKK